MRRREFITVLGGAAAAWPLAARAQQGDRVKRIGWLGTGQDGQDPVLQATIRSFDQEMARLGWTRGRNIHVEIRTNYAGDENRIRAYATELVAQAPDVILVNGTQATAILRQAASTMPIVLWNVADPIASGFVANMANPGRNITGFSSVEHSLAGKWLGILKDIAPSVTRVMVLYYPANPNWTGYVPTIEAL